MPSHPLPPPWPQLIDVLLLQYTVGATIASAGQSVMLLFAFEYVILSSDVVRLLGLHGS